MQQLARACVVLIALLAASCSDTDARLALTEPSSIGTSAVKISAASATSSAQPVDDPACPVVTPFKVPLGVVISISGSSSVVITSIRTEFTDTTGRRASTVTVPTPSVTLPAPGPTPVFGTPTGALFERTFPFVFDIGCETGPIGTAVIIVDGSDQRGRRFSERVSVAVR